jgi:hypothetical protein
LKNSPRVYFCPLTELIMIAPPDSAFFYFPDKKCMGNAAAATSFSGIATRQL